MGILKLSLRFAMEVTKLQRDLTGPLKSENTLQAATKKHRALHQRVPLLHIEKFIAKLAYTDAAVLALNTGQ